MSTTTPAPVAAAAGDTSPPSPTESPTPIARLAAPVALAVGAVLAGLGMALHLPATPEDVRLAVAIAEDPQWLSSHLLLGIGFALVALGAWSALVVLRGRAARPTAVGAVIASFGALAMSLSDMAHGAVGFALGDHVDPATSLDIHLAYFEHPAILGLNSGPMLLTLGMILLGVGLLRSPAVPRWQGIVLLAAPFAVHAAFIFDAPTITQGLAFGAGMIAFAVALPRMRPRTS